ncbi:hypothetical protein EIN_135990 [Entamoeba invadens IP1]|uniref:Uncharacterized protein n=1 Tax=Entamoeba invadens IP1 TaxID=370355 RepID=A0A0A1TXC3_ENTIV|nr:hypothetical protein EIN_135990 [Entamoeba invadens IP1]ELP85965.1 hypothetical protein EIN_135990 [Entamoeba invadens IP1]|eukprot:XP_004185311.1 hypothetical protein EIN_135990 [Entamoeba invadens IP1]
MNHNFDVQEKLESILEVSLYRTELEKTPRSPRIKVTKVITKAQNLTNDLTFDELDSEGRDSIDIYQVHHFLETSSVDKKPIYLLIKDVRQILNEMSLSKPYCVQRSEFNLLLKYIKDNQPTLEAMSLDNSLSKRYAALYIAPTIFCFMKGQSYMFGELRKEEVICEDKYHMAVKEMIFALPEKTPQQHMWKTILPDSFFSSEEFQRVLVRPSKTSLLRNSHQNVIPPQIFFEMFAPNFRFKDHANLLAGVHFLTESQRTLPESFCLRIKNINIGGDVPPETLRYVGAIYDQNSQEKLTENFVMENEGETFNVFFLTNQVKGSQVILVIDVLRRAGEDIQTARELYYKGFEDKKVRKKYTERKCWAYWQHLMFGYANLKDDFEKEKGEEQIIFFKSESENESIWEILENEENRKKAEMNASLFFNKNNENVQWRCGMNIWKNPRSEGGQTLCDSNKSKCQDFEKQPLKNGQKSDVEPPKLIRVLDNLRYIKSTEEIIFDFINRLYIYPLDVSFGKDKKKKTAICITFQVYYNKVTENCIYTPSGSLDSNYSSNLLVGKSFGTFDEIKIELPFPLKNGHFLVFTIQEIADGSVKKESFSILTLYTDNHINFQYGKLVLPIYSSLEEALAPPQIPTKKWLTVLITPFTTIYPTTPEAHLSLVNFLEGNLDQNFKNIPLIDTIHFLPVILQTFLESNTVKNIEVLALLMKTVCGHTNSSQKRNCIVESFVHKFCDFKSKETETNLIKALIILYKFDDTTPQTEILKHSWLPFEILKKSISQIGADQSFFQNLLNFATSFSNCIRSHIMKKEILGVEEGNAHFSYFIRSILELGYNSEAVTLMEEYLNKLTWPYDVLVRGKKYTQDQPEMVALTLLKTQFLAVFESSLSLYESSNPGNIDTSDITMLDDLLWVRHLPIAFLMRQHLFLLNKNEEINRASLYLMVGMVERLDLDSTLQGEKKECVAAMFLPFVVQFIESFEDFATWKFIKNTEKVNKEKSSHLLRTMGERSMTRVPIKLKEMNVELMTSDTLLLNSREKKIVETPLQNIFDIEMLGLIFVWVLKNLKKEVLVEWIKNEVPSRLQILVNILTRYILLFSYFPINETIDVYEEVDRNIKLIVNGLKEHGYFLNMNLSLSSAFSEDLFSPKSNKFSIPISRSLRLIRRDDEQHEKLHQVLGREIVRECLEVYHLIFNSLVNQEAMEHLEIVKTNIATKLLEEKVVNDDIFTFIKNLSISLITTGIVEVNEMNRICFDSCISALHELHKTDIKSITTSVVDIKRDLLTPNIQNLKNRKLIIRTETLGDIEALCIVLLDLIAIRLDTLKFLSEFKSTPVNKYSRMIETVVGIPFIINEKVLNNLETNLIKYDDLSVYKTVSKIMKNLKTKFKEVKLMETKMCETAQRNKELESQTSKLCEETKEECLKGIRWVLNMFVTLPLDIKNAGLNYLTARNRSEKYTKEAEELKSTYRKRLQILEDNPLFPVSFVEYEEIVNDSLKVSIKYHEVLYAIAKNMKMCITEDKRINTENGQQMSLLQKLYEDLLFNLDKTNSFEKSQKLKTMSFPKEIPFDKNLKSLSFSCFNLFIEVVPLIVKVLQKIDKIVEKTSNNQMKLEGAEKWFELERGYITSVIQLKEQDNAIKVVTKTPMHESSVVIFVMTDIIKTLITDGKLFKEKVSKSVELRGTLKRILFEEASGRSRNPTKRRITRRSLRVEDKTLRRMTVAYNLDNDEKAFGCIENENEMVWKFLEDIASEGSKVEKMVEALSQKYTSCNVKEKERETYRERVKALWETYRTTHFGNFSALKEFLIKEVDEDVPYDGDVVLIPDDKVEEKEGGTMKSDVQENALPIDAKIEGKKEEVVSKRVTRATKVTKRDKVVSLVEEMVTGNLDYNKMQKPKKFATQKLKVEVVEVSIPQINSLLQEDLITEKGTFVEDSFLDLNLYKISQYELSMKNLKKEVRQLMTKHTELNEIQQKARDPDSYTERLYTFACGYSETPRLYLKWVEKMAEEQAIRQNYLEAALAVTNLVIFVSHFLEGGKIFEKIRKISPADFSSFSSFGKYEKVENKKFDEVMKQEEIEGFNQSYLLKYVDSAVNYFMMKKAYGYAEYLLEATVEYLVSQNEIVRLQEVHNKMRNVYDQMSKNKSFDTHFYLVGFFGSVFEKMNEKEYVYHSSLPKDIFTIEIKGIVPFEKKKEIIELGETDKTSGLPLDQIYIKVVEVYPMKEDGEFCSQVFKNEFLVKSGQETYKRRIVYETAQPLPSLIRRQIIINKQLDIYMNAIETSLDEIDEMSAALNKATIPPITEELTEKLKVVLLGENGPIYAVENFLGKKIEEYPPEQISEMWELIATLLDNIKNALPVHLRNFPTHPLTSQFSNAFRKLKFIVNDAQINVQNVVGVLAFS